MYALFIVAPLARVDGAVLHRLFGGTASRRLSVVGQQERRSLFHEWL